MAFPTGWNSHKLTIDNTKVSGTANLTNFPVLVTEDNLLSGIWGSVNADGSDLRFTSDTAGTDLFDFENNNFATASATAGTAELWVKVGTVQPSTDTDFYVWFNNGTATDASNATSVWADFTRVFHGNDGTSTSLVDEVTTNADIGSKKGAGEPAVNTSGKVGDAQLFDDDNDYFQYTEAQVDDGMFLTWLNFTNTYSATATHFPVILDAEKAGANLGDWQLGFRQDSGKLRFQQNNGGTTASILSDGTTWTGGTWYHFITRWGANGMSMLVDGVAQADTDTLDSRLGGNTYTPSFGNVPGSEATFHFGGKLDEMMIVSSDKGDDYGITIYNNTNAPAAFITPSAIQVTRSLADTLALSDTLDRALNVPKTLSDSLAISDTLDRGLIVVKTLSDALAISDTLDSAKVIVAALSDEVGISDTLDSVRNLTRELEDSLALSESFVRVVDFSRELAETMALSESFDYEIFIKSTLADSIALSDSLTYAIKTSDSPFIKLIIVDSEIDDAPKFGDLEGEGDVAKMDSIE